MSQVTRFAAADRATGALVALAAMLFASSTRADEIDACVAAADQGQRLRRTAELRNARDAFLACARDECPAVVKRDCTRWLGEVTVALPTFVPTAHDERGRDVVGARLLLDGVVVPAGLDGRSLEVDPGVHRVRCLADRFEPNEVVFVAREGEKGRVVSIALRPAPLSPLVTPPPTAADTTQRGMPLATYAFGGLAIAAAGTASIFGALGVSDYNDLKRSCAPSCGSGPTNHVRTEFIVTDIAIGVALVSAGLATWFALSSRAH